MTGHPLLILVPTELEHRALEADKAFAGRALVRVCGLGPIVAAAESARCVQALRPARVLLVGIAGSYDLQAAPLGSAHFLQRVRCFEVGAHTPEGQVEALSLPQAGPYDGLREVLLEGSNAEPSQLTMLTVAAASGTTAQAQLRRAQAHAHLEDMEGFGVALACHAAQVPCSILRGVSNYAGERDPTMWRTQAALEAARAVAVRWCEA